MTLESFTPPPLVVVGWGCPGQLSTTTQLRLFLRRLSKTGLWLCCCYFPPGSGRFYRFSRVSNSTIYEGKQMMHLEFFTKLQNCIKIFFKILPLRFLQNDDEIARVPLGLQTSDTSSCLLNCPRAQSEGRRREEGGEH